MRYRATTVVLFALLALMGFALPRLASTAETNATGTNATATNAAATSATVTSATVTSATGATGASATGASATAVQRRRRATAARQRAGAARRDYSDFSHASAEHRKLECAACHKFPSPNWKEVRKADEAFPDVTEYPQHASCLNCHRAQFFARERPAPRICSVCHAGVTPRDNTRHAFPNPRERFDQTDKGRAHVSDFAVFFPHDKHQDVVTASLAAPRITSASFVRARWRGPRQKAVPTPAPPAENCSVCHQTYQPQGESDDEFVTKPPKDLAEDAVWLKKGTFKTTPTSHAACFTCHAQESGLKPEPTDCATCHKLPAASPAQTAGDFDPKLAESMKIKDKITLQKWRAREAGRFRHEWFSHNELRCDACHNVAAMNTTDERTKRVPVRSCGGAGPGAGCHIDPDGGVLNEAVAKKRADASFRCTKCHVVFGQRPLPPSHAAAVAARAN